MEERLEGSGLALVFLCLAPPVLERNKVSWALYADQCGAGPSMVLNDNAG